jgi:hypothetical protein
MVEHVSFLNGDQSDMNYEPHPERTVEGKKPVLDSIRMDDQYIPELSPSLWSLTMTTTTTKVNQTLLMLRGKCQRLQVNDQSDFNLYPKW